MRLGDLAFDQVAESVRDGEHATMHRLLAEAMQAYRLALTYNRNDVPLCVKLARTLLMVRTSASFSQRMLTRIDEIGHVSSAAIRRKPGSMDEVSGSGEDRRRVTHHI